MAQLPGAFNAKETEKLGDFSAIPAGDYLAQIEKSELKDTKAGDGQYIKLHFKVLDGEFSGRWLWTNLNIINKNPVAQEIAEKTLATISEICGQDVVTDTEVLHGCPMIVRVVKREATAQYAEQNDIKGYKSAEGVQSAGGATAPSNGGAKPATTPPWAKK